MSFRWLLKSAVILTIFLVSGHVKAQSLLKTIETLEKNSDDVAIRILIRKNFKRKLTVKEWFEIRKILIRRPKVGFDAIAAWDRQLSLKATALEKESDTVFKFLEKADEMALNRDFEKSFEMYQRAAKYLRTSNKGRIPKGNQQIYLNILHQMARTLYAQKRFREAVDVYTWIPPLYPQIRQVLFEKMWASFRAGKYDMALGAIASQQSGFFSEFLHPESYLLKIYIFKRLCRKRDLAFTIEAIKNYLASLKSGKFNYLEWARSDLYYMSLAQLVESEKNNSKAQLQFVSQKERDEEIRRVTDSLKIRFKNYRPTLQAQLERVYGYASLALSNDQEFLKPLSDLPEPKVLEKKGFELWPAGDAEEWLDEIGSHVYIGSSECKNEKIPSETIKQ
ncbi:MAG: hypothetical protein JNL11_16805 [Bdellovibrionaceae bacterium]|nr:hypothetical protein [Pseudobdellovibrionaceae bacterium]